MRGRLSRHLALAFLAALLFGLLAIGVSFVGGMTSASRHFDRAAAAQAQLAGVSRIEAIALGGEADAAGLAPLLADYRKSLERETRLLDCQPSAGQSREVAEVAELARLARRPGDADKLRTLVAEIATRERGEAREVATEMHALQGRMTALAVTLTGIAALLALAGGWALLTANRRLEQEIAARTGELANANARLLEIDRSRRLFFAKTGHELRTPITALRGEADVAIADPAPTIDSLREALGHMAVQAGLLGRRVEDLLSLARANDGKITLQRSPVDLAEVVVGAVEQARPHACSADVTLAVAGDPRAIPLLGDAKWLLQAIVAILDNGIKFAPAGSKLLLAVNRDADLANIAVTDSGPGVMPAELPRVFDAYYQTAEGAARGGSGLGLALARWVVDQHGGSITARNDDPGCTIMLRLPVTA